MGVVSRKIFPACERMFVCCPALRSRSKQPVKRYKKLLADIFPRSHDACLDERKILKLCEYAARNPLRIPKISNCLEERCYKELRLERKGFVKVVMEIYNQLLCTCKKQMPYFATTLLDVLSELLGNSKQVDIQVLGCQTFTRFIFAQADGTYAHNIESMVFKVCLLAEKVEGDHQRRLRAAALQCLSSMVWFMKEFSTIFVGFDKVVYVTLGNYELNMPNKDGGMIGIPRHNWVDEVVRRDGRDASLVGNVYANNCIISKPSPDKKDPCLLTREEVENPKVWAQICIQRMAELANEATTMRLIMDPVFHFLDNGKHWASRGLAAAVLPDISYFLETSENQHSLVSAVIHHLDHKGVSHNPEVKSSVIQVATIIARQTRPVDKLGEIAYIGDICRHLKKSFQLTIESVNEEQLKLNALLQCSIEECLLEIMEGVSNVTPLFDLMVVMLEKLPPVGVPARATIGSLIILAHVISSTSLSLYVCQAFPDALLLQILKAMFHPDTETRIASHQLFSVILSPGLSQSRNEATPMLSNCICMQRRRHHNSPSSFSSSSMLLKKFLREKSSTCCDVLETKEAEVDREEEKQPQCLRNFTLHCKLSPIIENDMGTHIVKFDEDQIGDLLSGFWLQTILPDNLPSSFEAIGFSLSLTIVSVCLKNVDDSLVVRICQLLLSLRRLSINLNNSFSPAHQRSIFVLSTSLLMFFAKICRIPNLNDTIRTFLPYDFDPYLFIGDDFQVYMNPGVDAEKYGSYTDNQLAAASLSNIQDTVSEQNSLLVDMLGKNISAISKLKCCEIVSRLSEEFVPDDALVIGSQTVSGRLQIITQSDQSLSLALEEGATTPFGEDSARSDFCNDEVSCMVSNGSTCQFTNVTSIGQVMKSAHEVADHMVGPDMSLPPLTYSTLAGQCEALGARGTKLPTYLTCEKYAGEDQPPFSKVKDDHASLAIIPAVEPWFAMRLPPASPFDNFLRAARC